MTDRKINRQAADVPGGEREQPAVPGAQRYNLRDVDFRRGNTGEARVIVDLSSPQVRRRRDDRFAGDLERLATLAGRELEDASAQEIVRWAEANPA